MSYKNDKFHEVDELMKHRLRYILQNFLSINFFQKRKGKKERNNSPQTIEQLVYKNMGFKSNFLPPMIMFYVF